MKEQVCPYKMILIDYNTPLSPIDRSSRQKKINKEAPELNNIINHIDLTGI
jgi:hypothetical protein